MLWATALPVRTAADYILCDVCPELLRSLLAFAGRRNSHEAAPDGPSTKRFADTLRLRYGPGSHIHYYNLGVGGTTSVFRVSTTKSLEVFKPDLIIWDYSSNDFSVHMHSMKRFRSVLEQLVRSLLSLPSQPAVMLLSLLRRGFDDHEGGWPFQDEALRPVAVLYGLPIVSYRDAVWPERAERKQGAEAELYYNTSRGRHANANVHPLWQAHQLIADVLAYAWAAVEHSMGRSYSPQRDPIPAMPLRAHFRDTEVEAVLACTGGWLTSLTASGDSQRGFEPVHPAGTGWRFVNDLPKKEGWQFDAELSPGARTSRKAREFHQKFMNHMIESTRGAKYVSFRLRRPHGWSAQAATALVGTPSLLEPITFRLKFGSKPRLAVSMLKSYERFGRLLFWIDDERAAAIELHRKHETYEWMCKIDKADALRHCGETWRCLALRTELLMNITNGHNCDSHFFGTSATHQNPFVLDGHWDDESSQTVTVGVQGTKRIDAVAQYNSALYAADATLALNVTPGWHRVSFAMLWPEPQEQVLFSQIAPRMKISDKAQEIMTRLRNGSQDVVLQEKGVPRTRAKLVGIHSC